MAVLDYVWTGCLLSQLREKSYNYRRKSVISVITTECRWNRRWYLSSGWCTCIWWRLSLSWHCISRLLERRHLLKSCSWWNWCIIELLRMLMRLSRKSRNRYLSCMKGWLLLTSKLSLVKWLLLHRWHVLRHMDIVFLPWLLLIVWVYRWIWKLWSCLPNFTQIITRSWRVSWLIQWNVSEFNL